MANTIPIVGAPLGAKGNPNQSIAATIPTTGYIIDRNLCWNTEPTQSPEVQSNLAVQAVTSVVVLIQITSSVSTPAHAYGTELKWVVPASSMMKVKEDLVWPGLAGALDNAVNVVPTISVEIV